MSRSAIKDALAADFKPEHINASLATFVSPTKHSVLVRTQCSMETPRNFLPLLLTCLTTATTLCLIVVEPGVG